MGMPKTLHLVMNYGLLKYIFKHVIMWYYCEIIYICWTFNFVYSVGQSMNLKL